MSPVCNENRLKSIPLKREEEGRETSLTTRVKWYKKTVFVHPILDHQISVRLVHF